jgi:hypothetical protein
MDNPLLKIDDILPWGIDVYAIRDGDAGIVTLADLVYGVRQYMFLFHNPNDLDADEFEEQTFVFPLVIVIETGKTAAAETERTIPLNRLTVSKIEEIIANMQQSASADEEFTVFDIKIRLFPINTPVGAGSNDFCDRMRPITAKTHYIDKQPVNCMAFALAYKMLNLHNPTRDLPRILQRARELQNECKFGKYVSTEQLEDFVRLYPEYRVTVLSQGLKNFSRLTYKGWLVFNHEVKITI